MDREHKPKENEDHTRLAHLEERLYSHNNPVVFRDRRSEIHKDLSVVQEDWQEENNEREINIEKPRTFTKFSRILFWMSLAIFVVTAAYTGYRAYFGDGTVYKNKIGVVLRGPSYIDGGEVFPIEIEVTNLNDVTLERVDAIVEYPKGESITSKEDAERVRIPVGNVAPGETKKVSTDIVLYGREGNTRNLKGSIEYYAPGSSVVYTKETEVSLTLKSAPVVITMSSLKESASNEEVTLTAEVRAERGKDLENFLLNIDYPNGFEYIGATPAPSFRNNVWSFDKIEKGDAIKIVLKGILKGEDGDEKVFRVYGGAPDRSDGQAIGVVFADTKTSIVLQKPFIALKGGFEGVAQTENGEYKIRSGERIEGFFTYQNNLPATISNVVITANIAGEIVNRNKVTVRGGFYNSSKNTLIWDRTTTPALAALLPGATGVLQFSVESFPLSSKKDGYFSQPSITLLASARGSRLGDTSVPEQTGVSVPLIAKVITEAGLQLSLSRDGNIKNTGPVPPETEKSTTYTLGIKILNRTNTLQNSTVSFVLPQYVSYTGITEGDNGKVSYQESTRTVSWDAGVVQPNTGFGGTDRTIYIQLAITPSVTQLGTAPILTNQIVLSATDTFTNTQITNQQNGPSTEDAGNGVIVK